MSEPKGKTSPVGAAGQGSRGIGDNGGPKITEPFGLRAAWLAHANEDELRRLAVLHLRITRRKRSLDEMVGERTTIMNRCIKRMRRAKRKT